MRGYLRLGSRPFSFCLHNSPFHWDCHHLVHSLFIKHPDNIAVILLHSSKARAGSNCAGGVAMMEDVTLFPAQPCQNCSILENNRGKGSFFPFFCGMSSSLASTHGRCSTARYGQNASVFQCFLCCLSICLRPDL